jgi:thiol-disulfide isomerase/thioredoxin
LLLLVVTALVCVGGGCKSGSAPRGNKTTSAPVVTAPKLAETAAPRHEPEPNEPAAAPEPANPANPAPAHKEGVEWKGNVGWRTWEEALPVAKREGKPILVLVYADWCPHCRTLAPAFGDPQVEALAKHFVMVRQNDDDDPAWLEPYKKYGGYVPRVFFFDSKGQLRDDITSGHPRYPFFYAAEHIDFLKQSMRRVMGS